MANNRCKVFLGFEDELINHKYQTQVNYTTNKVGGNPDWIEKKQFPNPVCHLCGLSLPLIVQLYAPLEKSPYHRTLYIFGCINPNCWNQNKSWVCLRSQLLDTTIVETEVSEKSVQNFDWCDGANDWEDEENGNVVPRSETEEDIYNESVNSRLAKLELGEGEMCGGAAGQPQSPVAEAEIEGEEEEVITIDSPVTAEVDVVALLDQVKPVPQVPSESFQFVSFFLSVMEEGQTKLARPSNLEFSYHQSTAIEHGSLDGEVSSSECTEKYEKSLPAHGDKLFHHFISKIQKNPGQLLRYIRDGGSPLLLYPVQDVPKHCQHCGGPLVYEVQLLPTLLSRLRLKDSGCGHLEYGTVLVLTCHLSCWVPGDSLRSEYVLVQREL